MCGRVAGVCASVVGDCRVNCLCVSVVGDYVVCVCVSVVGD